MTSRKILKYSNQIEDLLGHLSDEEIVSLATTVTGGLLKTRINDRQDAVKAIISYSEDLPSILRRKIFTREKLLTYLYEKNVAVKLPSTKPEIIKQILKLWKRNSEEGSDWGNSTVDNETVYGDDDLDDTSLSSNTSINTNRALSIEPQVEFPPGDELCKPNSDLDNQSTVNVLAEQFSQWFYKLLNENQLASEHFFPDASLNITLQSNGESNNNIISNDPQAITNCLLSTKIQYDLFFNPNLTKNGLKSEMDPHGLVIVMVCGTLHSKSVCVGVFEQMFALARDPFAENNWKMKRTDLTLKSSNSNPTPRLCEENVNSASGRSAIAE